MTNEAASHTLKILHDEDTASPRENDNLGTLACWHRRYTLGDVQPKGQPADYEDALEANSLVVPVYLYDHSGLALSTKDFGDQWDSGQVGFYHVTPAQIVEAYGEDTEANRNTALEAIQSEIAVYSDYINGNCWGYQVENAEGEVVDSCWGFIGSDIFENGLVHNLPSQYLDLVSEAASNAGLTCGAEDLAKWKTDVAAQQAARKSSPSP